MTYREHYQFICPHCEQDSRAVVMDMKDRWQVDVSTLVCQRCEEPLAANELTEGLAPVMENQEKARAALARLADFLNVREPADSALQKARKQGRICEACDHFVPHRFDCRCLVHLEAVAPNYSCKEFHAS